MFTQHLRQIARVIPMLAMSFAVAVPAAAQHRQTGDNAEANRLHAQAEAILAGTGLFETNLERASDLHATVAAMRTVDDPRFVDCMTWQGELSYATGEFSEARRLFELAGDGALATGDVYNAGIAYAKAAKLAHTQGVVSEASRLSDKVVLLTRSPLLSERERQHLRDWVPEKTNSNP